MANLGDKKSWDPYETSQRRDFVYIPNSVTPAMRPMTSKGFENPYWSTGPGVSTVYNEEFCWKPASKPASIRTGSSSGNRRNNPHPSQAFLVWRLPPSGLLGSSTDNESLQKNLMSEQDIRDVLSAQYCSTYRTDYLGIPPGFEMKHAVLAPLGQKQDVLCCAETEMRHGYKKPQQKPELKGNTSRYGCNAEHKVATRGVVPTVVQSHIQENSKQLTTYDKHYGGAMEDVCRVLRSLKPQELQQFTDELPVKGRKALRAVLGRPAPSGPEKMNKDPLVLRKSPGPPVRISTWPGPL